MYCRGHIQTPKIKLHAKIVSGCNPLTIFAKNIQLRYLTGFWIHLETLYYFFAVVAVFRSKVLVTRFSFSFIFMQKQSPGGALLKRCSYKFHKTNSKTPVLESLFNKFAGLKACSFIKKWLQRRNFHMNFSEIFKRTLWWLPLFIKQFLIEKKVLFSC